MQKKESYTNYLKYCIKFINNYLVFLLIWNNGERLFSDFLLISFNFKCASTNLLLISNDVKSQSTKVSLVSVYIFFYVCFGDCTCTQNKAYNFFPLY